MIANLKHYTSEMNKSLADKLFCLSFLVDCDLIVEYGCADASLLWAIGEQIEEARLIGFDLNEDMLLLANLTQPENSLLTTSWGRVEIEVIKAKRPAIILSSVLHEIYSQAKHDSEWFRIWERIRAFNVICIRDMCVDEALKSTPTTIEVVDRLMEMYPILVADFRKNHGSIKTEHDLLHFLLKYRYTHNWEHEVREDYLGMNLRELMNRTTTLTSRLEGKPYQFAHLNHFTHPYIVEQIERDTGIQIGHKTHIECVLTQ